MSEQDNKYKEEKYLELVFKLLYSIIALMILIGLLVYVNFGGVPDVFKLSKEFVVVDTVKTVKKAEKIVSSFWQAPDTVSIHEESNAEQINYGRRLISNTAYYLGPNGTVAHISNGMNCQNCHLDAGTKVFGNNYSAVASTYPKFRERSGMMENIYKRVNDCIERSLNGIGLDSLGKEMQAIKAYIVWLGKDVKKGVKPKGSGLTDIKYLDRAADPEKGKLIYVEKCQSCHGLNGEGKMNVNKIVYLYPPLWGEHSYNTGAGLFRLSRFAGYVKSNMPLGASYENPQLTDEQVWDVAAFVNSKVRPIKNLSKDWPKLSGKPFDHPYGPYSDSFSEQQHKYGPFEQIVAFKKKQKKNVK